MRSPRPHPHPAWRPAPPLVEVDRICSFTYQRTVSHDNTLQLGARVVQVHPGPGGRSYTGARVNVHVHLDDRLTVDFQGRRLRFRLLPTATRPVWHFRKKPRAPVAVPLIDRRTLGRPLPPEHPWRLQARADARRRGLPLRLE